MKRFFLYITAVLLSLFAVPAFATITVTSPSNGATVASPFVVSASSTVCQGVPTKSMAYSLDSQTDNVKTGTSLKGSVVASLGTHVLHVKCWGVNAHEDVKYTVNVVPATNITVASPATGASLLSPITISASSSMCGGLPAVSMGYSFDSGTDTVEPTAFTASAPVDAGTHTLHIKCWGAGSVDQQLLSINVLPPPVPTATPSISIPSGKYFAAQSVVLSDATANAAIYYTEDGTTPTVNSTLYTGPINVKQSETVQAIALAPGDVLSAEASATYNVKIGPPIPDYAQAINQIQTLPNWRIKHDPGTPGTAVGVMTLVSDPALSGQAAKFYTTYSGWGGVLYSDSYYHDPVPTNWVYDAYVQIASGSTIANLEMDLNQVVGNGDTIIYAFQCAGASGVWEYTENAGTRTATQAKWLHSNQPCNPAQWTKDTWHHVQIWTSRDDSGNVTYHSVWLDGVEYPINQTVMSDFALGWGAGVLVANFQVDDTSANNASSTLYLDNFTVYRW